MLPTGSRVHLLVSDPWDFGTQVGTGPFPARIRTAGPEPERDGQDQARSYSWRNQ
jgi:hypothetical protein